MKRDLRHRLAADEARLTYPTVHFDDFPRQRPHSETCGTQESWPEAELAAFERTFVTAAQSALLLHRETLDIAQRNVNCAFSLLRKLVGIKNYGAIFDLQCAYWRNQLGAFTGQVEEISALSTKAATDMVEALVTIAQQRVAAQLTGLVRGDAAPQVNTSIPRAEGR